jgi:hypothetical protein
MYLPNEGPRQKRFRLAMQRAGVRKAQGHRRRVCESVETAVGLDPGKRRFRRFEKACASEKWRGSGESPPSRPFSPCVLGRLRAALVAIQPLSSARSCPSAFLLSYTFVLYQRSARPRPRRHRTHAASVLALPNIAPVARTSCGRRAAHTVAASGLAFPRPPAIRAVYTARARPARRRSSSNTHVL